MPRNLLCATLLALTTAVGLAACGSGSQSASSGGANAAATDKAATAASFSRCMRAHGVPNFPDPSQSGGATRIQATHSPNGAKALSINGVPVNAPAFQAAQKQCAAYAPKGPPLSAGDVAKLRAAALAMARCMRSHGVPDFPDPQVSTGADGSGIGIRIGGPGGLKLDPSAPSFKRAQQSCGPILKRALPGGGPRGVGG